MRLSGLVPALLGAAFLAACSSPIPEGASVIEVSDAYIVKPAEGRDIAGAGMVVKVRGADQRLIAATTDIASRVELHTMSMEGGMMKMRQVEAFNISAKSPLVLERGGNHLMLFGVSPGLAVGDSVDMILTFDNGQGKEQMLVAKAEVVGQDD